MKRILLAFAAATVVALAVEKSSAEAPATVKTPSTDWRSVWHAGKWWYWTDQNSWLVWSGSAWTPYRPSNGDGVAVADQPRPYVANYGSYEAPAVAAAPQPIYSGRETYGYSGQGAYRPAYTAGPRDYSGYGWTWGPGTAFRDSPGRRF